MRANEVSRQRTQRNVWIPIGVAIGGVIAVFLVGTFLRNRARGDDAGEQALLTHETFEAVLRDRAAKLQAIVAPRRSAGGFVELTVRAPSERSCSELEAAIASMQVRNCVVWQCESDGIVRTHAVSHGGQWHSGGYFSDCAAR